MSTTWAKTDVTVSFVKSQTKFMGQSPGVVQFQREVKLRGRQECHKLFYKGPSVFQPSFFSFVGGNRNFRLDELLHNEIGLHLNSRKPVLLSFVKPPSDTSHLSFCYKNTHNTANYDYLPGIFDLLKYFFTPGLKKRQTFLNLTSFSVSYHITLL